jgi:hypothetical protein
MELKIAYFLIMFRWIIIIIHYHYLNIHQLIPVHFNLKAPLLLHAWLFPEYSLFIHEYLNL